jgi:hypothetical protein
MKYIIFNRIFIACLLKLSILNAKIIYLDCKVVTILFY